MSMLPPPRAGVRELHLLRRGSLPLCAFTATLACCGCVGVSDNNARLARLEESVWCLRARIDEFQVRLEAVLELEMMDVRRRMAESDEEKRRISERAARLLEEWRSKNE